jgi:2,3-bisphosphoglycerate-independent phosphoglycerate mutase
MPQKLLYVCLDGLGDDPLPQFDGRTPLEAARTPNLDALAKRGRQGIVYTVGKGIAPESDIAVFAILGYDPREEHPGRGVLEALGSDMEFHDGDLALRVNFATSDGDRIADRRVGRDLSSEEAKALATEVNEKVTLPRARFELRATIEHRGALVIHSDEGPLSAEILNTDPAYAKQGSLGVALERFEERVVECAPVESCPIELTDEARLAARLVNRFVRESARVLDASEINQRRRTQGRLPANLILTRDAGDHVPKLQPIRERFGLEWGCFVEMPVERGISMALRMTAVDAPTPPDPRERYAAWAELALEAVGGFDALYIHIKGPDVPAHDGRAEDKRDVIQAIDEAFFSQIAPAVRDGIVVAVTADHSTSCARKAHTDDPVPLLVAGRGVSSDAVATFGERAAARGAIGQLEGVQIVPLLLDVLRG